MDSEGYLILIGAVIFLICLIIGLVSGEWTALRTFIEIF